MLKAMLSLLFGLLAASAQAAGAPPAVSTAAASHVQSSEIEFEEVGEYVASRSESPEEAEKKAVQDALERAMAQRVTITSQYDDSQVKAGKSSKQFISSYLNTFSGGVVNHKMVGEPEITPMPGRTMKYVVRVKGSITFNGDPDPSFEVRFDPKDDKLKRLGLNHPEFYEGDEVTLSFWSTKEAFIQLIVLDSDNNASLLYPNKHVPVPRKLKPGEIFIYPGDKAESPDLKVVAALPPGKEEAIEYLHILLTKGQPLFSTAEARESDLGPYKVLNLGDRSVMQKRLSKLKRSRWTQMVIPYRIQTRPSGQ
ncbi:MAG TPA: hypothetical protein DCM05_05470 [Elusimicrobia bacterium]|nr:hypothetical protein [Elusimicrobiota bacterium]